PEASARDPRGWGSSMRQRYPSLTLFEIAVWESVTAEIRIFTRFFVTRSVSEGPARLDVIDEAALSLVPTRGRWGFR
ncbi:MAG: hypothetical protein ACK53L_25355, partial [Pirellulaceae bacterium]